MRLCEVPKIINFKGTAIKRTPSFFICKDAAFGNSIAQKKAYSLAVHILYVILPIICTLQLLR